ncbi:hypothetical protein ACRAWD_25730 [Caulobacter segnis]
MIAAYLLALFWSPEACRAGIRVGQGHPVPEQQLRLHGPRPVAERSRPRARAHCRPSPPMSPATVKANSGMTPSPWLLQHEWQAHGTCRWDTPEAYFKKAQKSLQASGTCRTSIPAPTPP